MNKKFILAVCLLAAVFLASCSKSAPAPESADNILVITSAHINPTEKANPNAPEIKEEIVTKATVPAVTEPAAKAEKTTKPTEPAAKKKKNTTQTIPVHGEVNPNLNIQVTTAPSGKLEGSDFDFELDGAYVYLGDDIDDVVALAGDDNSVTELSETEIEYEYVGLSFTSVIKGKSETLTGITITSADFPTPKGAVVGMYATNLREIYGEASQKSDELYTYASGKKSLEFTVENNIVTSISYKLKH